MFWSMTLILRNSGVFWKESDDSQPHWMVSTLILGKWQLGDWNLISLQDHLRDDYTNNTT